MHLHITNEKPKEKRKEKGYKTEYVRISLSTQETKLGCLSSEIHSISTATKPGSYVWTHLTPLAAIIKPLRLNPGKSSQSDEKETAWPSVKVVSLWEAGNHDLRIYIMSDNNIFSDSTVLPRPPSLRPVSSFPTKEAVGISHTTYLSPHISH